MPKITETLFDDFFVVYLLIFAAAAAFNWAYKRRIRMNHAEAWKALGSPTLLSNNSILNGLRSTNFLLRKRYEELGDETLNFYGRWARAGLLAIIGYLGLSIIFVVIGQVQNGVWSQRTVIVTHPLNLVGASMLLLVLALLVFNTVMTRRIRTRHPEMWNNLGKPSFLNNTTSNGWKLLGYVWSDQRSRVGENDALLSCYVWAVRCLMVVFAVLWIAVLTEAIQT